MISRCLNFALAGCVLPVVLLAQKPPELSGRVRGADGSAVSGAIIELVEAGASTQSDASGGFRMRVDQSGDHSLRVTRLGWLPVTVPVRLRAGTLTAIDIVLQPDPVIIDPVVVAGLRAEGQRVGRAELERIGGSTATAALVRMPGVVIVTPVPGGPEYISVRGSGRDQVLVLLDGAAINDPVTGEADLSRIPIAIIESITLITGAQSARFGAGALAGVVLIETRTTDQHSASIAAGSLGRWSVSGNTGGSDPLPWSAGLAWRSLHGAFDFELPPELGSKRQRRGNADAGAMDAYLSAGFGFLAGRARARAAAQTEERGLPGRGYAPSPFARQELRGGRASFSWERVRALHSLQTALSMQTQRTIFQDQEPPFGLAYDDTVDLSTVDLRTDYARQWRGIGTGVGMSARLQRIATPTLDQPTQPATAGAYLQASGAGTYRTADFRADLQVRGDYDRGQDRVYASHLTALSAVRGSITLRLANRTAFSPPGLGDQFFRSGIGIEANPDLRAERAHEYELRARWQPANAVTVDAAAFMGGIEDLIVWAPDYRFVWSPQNENVARRGVELSARAHRAHWRASATFTHARITYDRIAGDVQVAYRPRDTGTFSLEHRANGFDLRLESSYIGQRTTAPTALNTLPGFWTTAAAIAVRAQPHNIATMISLRADRLLNEKGTLIFGFPDPGRQFVVELRLGGSHSSTLSARTSQ